MTFVAYDYASDLFSTKEVMKASGEQGIGKDTCRLCPKYIT